MNVTKAHLAANQIKQLYPDFNPKIGIVLGSGLGSFVDELENPHFISYQDLPGFQASNVLGHESNLVIGKISGIDIICLQGRAHAYEGIEAFASIKTYIRTLKLLGCEYFVATNASGSLCEQVGPGELMLITDHINMQGTNPLIGPNDDEFGPRFLPLDNAYDFELRNQILEIAKKEDIDIHQGVYCAVLGPNYETTAEIKAFKLLGADAVGMSTVAEVLVANHCGMKVAVIATITNYATGLATCSHSHDNVVLMASKAATRLNKLIKGLIKELG